MNLEQYFSTFQNQIVGKDETFLTPFGERPIHYYDWTATGRGYLPLELQMISQFGGKVGNTHTESNETGGKTTKAYHHALNIIKKHVNANEQDVVITTGSGTTAAINKLQRLLGLRIHENFYNVINWDKVLRPVVFITHMEHHSNHTSWLETIADVVVMKPNKDGQVDPDELKLLLQQYDDRVLKIGSFTACSNVTGIKTPYHTLARIMHEHKGFCFVDFAASAPYVEIDMHPKDPLEQLDGIFFSPHKFLGGFATSGVLIFNSSLYKNKIPDHPGGGTVSWTNPQGGKQYITNIEEREDGGTPGFLQAIRIGMAIKLKEKMGIENILKREEELLDILWKELEDVPTLHILDGHIKNRLGIVSFYEENIHYNLFVRLLNDHFGVQVRGGCSCAGTYGHFLLNIQPEHSKKITDEIDKGNVSVKPGWVRLSLHPTMSNQDVFYLTNAIKYVVEHIDTLKKEYRYISEKNDFEHITFKDEDNVSEWFKC